MRSLRWYSCRGKATEVRSESHWYDMCHVWRIENFSKANVDLVFLFLAIIVFLLLFFF